MVFLWTIVRKLDPGAAAVWMLALALAATVAGRHDEALRRLLLRCGVSLILFGYVQLKASQDGRDDHDSHLVIGAIAVPVGIVALLVPSIAAPAVIALAVAILVLELRDSRARRRGRRWTLRGRRVRIDFSVGAVIGLALLAAAPSAQGQSPGPVLTATAGWVATVMFGWLCVKTSCPADDPGLPGAVDARAASERMLHSLEPELAATLMARMNADPGADPLIAPSPATLPAVAAERPVTPARGTAAPARGTAAPARGTAAPAPGIGAAAWDTSRSVPPPGSRR